MKKNGTQGRIFEGLKGRKVEGMKNKKKTRKND